MVHQIVEWENRVEELNHALAQAGDQINPHMPDETQVLVEAHIEGLEAEKGHLEEAIEAYSGG